VGCCVSGTCVDKWGRGGLPLEGTEARDGAHHGETRRVGNSRTLGDGAVVRADGAAVVVAARDRDASVEGGAESGIGTEGSHPEEGHEEVEGQHRPNVICPAGRRHLFRDKQVRDHKPGEQALRNL